MSSLLHLYFPAYFLLNRGNFLSLRPQFIVLTQFILPLASFNLAILGLQRYFGPRFCIPCKIYRKDLRKLFNLGERGERRAKFKYERNEIVINDEECAICLMKIN